MITEQDKLQGTVIIDNFYIKVKDSDGYLEEKYPILIAVEINEKKIGRIRMSNIECDDSYAVADFVKSSLEPSDNTILSDGSIDLSRPSNTKILSNKKIDFSKVPKTSYSLKIFENQKDNFQPIQQVVSYLENKKLLNSLSCKRSDKHLDNYLNECCFKFNRKDTKKNWL